MTYFFYAANIHAEIDLSWVTMRQSTRQRAFVPVAAAAHGDRLRQQRVDRGIPAKERRRMPDTGFFAEADPTGTAQLFINSIINSQLGS